MSQLGPLRLAAPFLLLAGTLLALLAAPRPCGGAEMLTLEGRVLAPGGVPLAGAEVEMWQVLSRFEQGVRELAGIPAVSLQAVSDSRGDYALPVPREAVVEVRVSAPGFLPMRFVMAPLFASRLLPAVSLVPDSGLRVRVLGPEGKGVRGAGVLAQPIPDSPGWLFPWGDDLESWEAAPRSGETGENGEVRLPARRGERLRLFAQAPGFPIQGALDVRAPAEAELHLAAGVRHELRLRSGTGPLTQAALVVDLQTGWLLGMTKNGTLPVVGPAQGTAWLAVETEGAGGWPFAVPAGSREVRVKVPAPRALAVRVSDTLDRKPLAGAWVWDPRDPGRSARTDASGVARYRTAAPSVRERLQAVAPGHLRGQRHWSRWTPEGELALALPPAPVYLGKVVDEAGRPAAGAEARIAGGVGRVSARGEVRVVSAWEVGGPRLEADGPGFRGLQARLGPLPARENRFAVTLRRGAEVAGRIVDGRGAGVPEAEVRLDFLAELGPLGPEPGPSTVSDGTGRFRVGGVLPGAYELRVQAPGRAPFRRGGLEVRAAPSGAAGPQDLGTFALDEGTPLAGRIAGPGGEPLAGVEVWLQTREGSQEDGPWPVAVSGADGRFALAGLGAETALHLTLCRLDRAAFELELNRPPAEPLALVLPPAGLLVGRELDEDGLPRAQSSVEAWLGYDNDDELHSEKACPGPPRKAGTDPSGWFRIGPLPPRLYDVEGAAVPLAGGEVREIEVRPHSDPGPQGSLTGRLLDAQGLPVAGVDLRLDNVEPFDDRGFMSMLSSTTDGLGRFWFDGLATGRWGLGLRDTLNLEEVRIDPGVNRHDLALPGKSPRVIADLARRDLGELSPLLQDEVLRTGTARVAGRLLGLSPEELAGARVGLSFGVGVLSIDWLGTVAPDGRYEIAGLAPVEGIGIVAQAGDRRMREEVRIVAGVDRVARDLVFPPVVPLSGEVVGPDEEAIPGAQLTFWSETGPAQFPWERFQATSSGADGKFSLRLPAGTYRVQAERPGYQPIPWSEERTMAATDPPTSDWESRLRMQRAVELRGRLPGLTPEDVRRVEVHAADDCCTEEGRSHFTDDATVGPDGLYRIAGLGPGKWDVKATLKGARLGRRSVQQRIEIPEGATEAVLDLDFRVGDLAIAGQVVGQGMAELPGGWGRIAQEVPYDVAAQLADGTQVAATSVRHGAFRLGFLRPGRYVLVLTRGPYPYQEVARQEVELPRQEPVVWDVRGAGVR